MKVVLWALGTSSDAWVNEGEMKFIKRIAHYMPFEYQCFQPSKSSNTIQVLEAEAKWLNAQLDSTPSKLILLDEKGTQYTSVAFSKKLESWRQGSYKRIIFLIGSAYGFHPDIYSLSNEKLSISTMTLPHQLCRLIFLEQIYRACTILRGESYHHE